jgi:hypothetical protein
MEPIGAKKVEPFKTVGLSGFGYTLQFACHNETCKKAVREDFTKEGNIRAGLEKGPRILVCGSCSTQHKVELDRGTVKVTKM